jgi:hypothetical protein
LLLHSGGFAKAWYIVRAARDWVVAGWFNQENTPDTVIEEKKALSAKLESLL